MKSIQLLLISSATALLASKASAAVLLSGGTYANPGADDRAFVFKVTEDISITQIGGPLTFHANVDPNSFYFLYLVDYNNNVLAGASISSLDVNHPVWIMKDLGAPLTLHPGTYAFYRIFGDHPNAGSIYDYGNGAIVPYSTYTTETSTSGVFSHSSGSAAAPVAGSGWMDWHSPIDTFATMTYTVVPEPGVTAALSAATLAVFAAARRRACRRSAN